MPKHMSLWGTYRGTLESMGATTCPDNGTYPRWVSPTWEAEYSSWAITMIAFLEALACYHIHVIYTGFSHLICFLSTKSQTSYQALKTDSGPVLGSSCPSLHGYSDTRSFLCHGHCLSPLRTVTWESPRNPQRWCFYTETWVAKPSPCSLLASSLSICAIQDFFHLSWP